MCWVWIDYAGGELDMFEVGVAFGCLGYLIGWILVKYFVKKIINLK